jgi:hypothetical protein
MNLRSYFGKLGHAMRRVALISEWCDFISEYVCVKTKHVPQMKFRIHLKVNAHVFPFVLIPMFVSNFEKSLRIIFPMGFSMLGDTLNK